MTALPKCQNSAKYVWQNIITGMYLIMHFPYERFSLYLGDSRIIQKSWQRCICNANCIAHIKQMVTWTLYGQFGALFSAYLYVQLNFVEYH